MAFIHSQLKVVFVFKEGIVVLMEPVVLIVDIDRFWLFDVDVTGADGGFFVGISSQGLFGIVDRKGSRGKGLFATLVHSSERIIVAAVMGVSSGCFVVGLASIFLTKSMLSMASPKTVCRPSNHGVYTFVMKNCDPLVLVPVLAMESATLGGHIWRQRSHQ